MWTSDSWYWASSWNYDLLKIELVAVDDPTKTKNATKNAFYSRNCPFEMLFNYK